MRKVTCTIMLAALLLPAAAVADSDGYYCAGPGYVAFETRFSSTPGRHLLHIVQFSRATGIVRMPPIELEDFQVHAMRCRDRVVELQAWTAAYTADFSNSGQPAVRTRSVTFEPGASAGAENLGHWSRPAIVDLQAADAPGEFQLVIARVSRRVPGGIEHFTSTGLIQRDRAPGPTRVLQTMDLFFGVFLETVD